MAFQARVINALIASPSDVTNEREVIKETINNWNAINSEYFKVVYLPKMWEHNTIPEYRVRPSGPINNQIVDKSDLLIGFFWCKIGTETGEAAFWDY